MANPLTTARNKYYLNQKNSSIYTPKRICDFLALILMDYIEDYSSWYGNKIIDPAVGTGNLLRPFREITYLYNGITTIGYDIKDCSERKYTDIFIKKDFLTKIKDNPDVNINESLLFVICNPPFNNDTESKYNKKLLPELFARKVFELYGYGTPLILFAPMGMRLNQRIKSKRYRWLRDCKAQISSIISLPLDIFPNVEFHNEILIFNMPNGYLKPHYFLPEENLLNAT